MKRYELDIKKIINLFYVQKSLFITVFAVVFTLAVYTAMSLPNVYRSSTLILITPQKLPPSYVNSTITWSIEQRVRAISEDILSRTQLEKIVQEFALYPTVSKLDARVNKLRNNILIDVRRNETFALSFEHPQAEKAMQVTSRIGALFIHQNLEMREQQAAGTTTFIDAEADRLRKELEEQEAEVNLYKAKHRFELPEQLDANLRTLEQVRHELQANVLRLSSLDERKRSLEKQFVEAKYTVPDGARSADGQRGVPGWQSLEDRKLQLEDLRTRYSDKHPDVVRLRKEIQSIEADAKLQQSQNKESPDTSLARSPLQQTLLKQIADLSLEIKTLQSTNDSIRGQIASYQARIDNSPVRAIELTKISRAYDITLKKYQDLQTKSLDSQLSENMEKKQKGEQFQIIDAANLPQQPIGPNRVHILLGGMLAAIAASFGLVFLQENLNSSFKRGDEIRDHTSIPILATIPAVNTRGSILEHRRAQRMLVLASGIFLVVGIVSIRFYTTLLF
jgi:polysaccharide chain length determinant protein (PEP-CTERM system associated)